MSKKTSFHTNGSRSPSSSPEEKHANPRLQPTHPTGHDGWDVKEKPREQEESGSTEPRGAGLLPDEVYARTLNWWRAAVRRQIVKNIGWESRAIAKMQEYIRTPFLDAYFVYTSSLGTHTFFTILLPAFFFFGYEEYGRGLLAGLTFGVYTSSFMKDLVCAPRPYAPPVTRLTIGNHHLEYGFPSTHSTNSVTVALYVFAIIYQLYKTPALAASSQMAFNSTLASTLAEVSHPETLISQTWFYALSGILAFYVFSVVFGRLYTGMHSFTDCVVGILLGVAVWVAQAFLGPIVDTWVSQSGWIVPVTVISLCSLLIHLHPQPVDDCPCFEDATAVLSVVVGEYITRWFLNRSQLGGRHLTLVMPGHPRGDWGDVVTWWTIAISKMTIGILAIFAWRIFAKFLMHRILPPTFRFLAQLVTLPHRRFYTPATDYKNVPDDNGLRPIPSLLDLSGSIEEMGGDNSIVASTGRNKELSNGNGRQIKLRKGGKSEKSPLGKEVGLGIEELGGKPNDGVKHYDADVLTKVFVYAGIGMLATGALPLAFQFLGWGVKIN